MSQLINDLLDARDYLIEHGWCQRSSREMDGRVCAVGAVYKITDNEVYSVEDENTRRMIAYRALTETLVDLVGNVPIAVWNDDPERKIEDVIWLYDSAIDRVKSAGA